MAPARRSAYLSRLADQAMLGMAHMAHDRVPDAQASISTTDAMAGVTDIARAQGITFGARELFSSNG